MNKWKLKCYTNCLQCHSSTPAFEWSALIYFLTCFHISQICNNRVGGRLYISGAVRSESSKDQPRKWFLARVQTPVWPMAAHQDSVEWHSVCLLAWGIVGQRFRYAAGLPAEWTKKKNPSKQIKCRKIWRIRARRDSLLFKSAKGNLSIGFCGERNCHEKCFTDWNDCDLSLWKIFSLSARMEWNVWRGMIEYLKEVSAYQRFPYLIYSRSLI